MAHEARLPCKIVAALVYNGRIGCRLKLPIAANACAGQQSSMSVQHAMILQPERPGSDPNSLLQRLLSQDVPEDTHIIQMICTNTQQNCHCMALSLSKDVPSMFNDLAGQAGCGTSEKVAPVACA